MSIVRRAFILWLFVVSAIANAQALNQVFISNNHLNTDNYSDFQSLENSYLCSLLDTGFFNNAFHYGLSNEPAVGDYIVYNDNYAVSQSFLSDHVGFTIVKLRDYNKLIEIRKLNGQIVSVYNCTSGGVISAANIQIYLENSTCKCPNSTVGDTALINGTTYTVVDNSTIVSEIANGNVNLCTTLVTDMSSLFRLNRTFNSDISFWDTSNVTNMRAMFDMSGGGGQFNQEIGRWDTSNVMNMNSMFQSLFGFNQDLGDWNTSNVTDMNSMFGEASSFNQDLSDWCVQNIISEPINFSAFSALTEVNKPIWGSCPSN